MIPGLVLPKRLSGPARDPVCTSGRRSFQPSHRHRHRDYGKNQQMHVIRHDEPRTDRQAKPPAPPKQGSPCPEESRQHLETPGTGFRPMPHSFHKAQAPCGAGDLVAGVSGFETKSPADGKDRQRHNAGLPFEKTMWHRLQAVWFFNQSRITPNTSWLFLSNNIKFPLPRIP
jgi:hypothetical protein